MCKGIAKILNPEDFDSIQNTDDLRHIDLGDELIPLIQTVLGRKEEEREALQAELDAEFDSDFISFKEKVAELKARWPQGRDDWEELQELERGAFKLLQDLKQKRKEKQGRLGKLTRQIEELNDYLQQMQPKQR
jgi:chromosome segregation ATPase